MGENPQKNKIDFISIIVAVVLIGFAIIFLKSSNIGLRNVQIKKISSPILPKVQHIVEKKTYDIDKIKGEGSKSVTAKAKDMESVYKNYSPEDTGGDLVEAWSKVSPEEKTKLAKGIDGQIESTRALLEANPEDKKAIAKLKISQSLKKLMASNFNYKAKE